MRKTFVAVLLFVGTIAFAQISVSEFKVEKLADGVYGLIRQDPPGWMVVSNCVFIINDDDVVVVDTGGSNSLAKQMIAELRKLTDKPVRYVINTHWHDDHILGNAAYREAFPLAEFVAHAATFDYLPTKGVAARKSMEEGAPGFSKFLQDHLDKKESLAGGPMGNDERAAYESDVRLAARYMAEVKSTPIVLPTITLEDRWTLHRGDRTIDVRYFGRAHTSGDIVVYLPKEGILITGDIVIAPVPLVGGDQSHVVEWATTLGKLRALKHPLSCRDMGRLSMTISNSNCCRACSRQLLSNKDENCARRESGADSEADSEVHRSQGIQASAGRRQHDAQNPLCQLRGSASDCFCVQ